MSISLKTTCRKPYRESRKRCTPASKPRAEQVALQVPDSNLQHVPTFHAIEPARLPGHWPETQVGVSIH